MEETKSKPFVLFIYPSDGPSMKALEIANKYFHIIDIQDIQNIVNRPNWLCGVPTLVHVAKKEIYYGNHAIEVLKYIHENEPVGVGFGMRMMNQSTGNGFPISDSMNDPLGESNLLNSSQQRPVMRMGSSCEIDNQTYMSVDNDLRYTDEKKPKTTEESIQQYMKMRDQRLNAIMPPKPPNSTNAVNFQTNNWQS
jgi:hypothetical protein